MIVAASSSSKHVILWTNELINDGLNGYNWITKAHTTKAIDRYYARIFCLSVRSFACSIPLLIMPLHIVHIPAIDLECQECYNKTMVQSFACENVIFSIKSSAMKFINGAHTFLIGTIRCVIRPAVPATKKKKKNSTTFWNRYCLFHCWFDQTTDEREKKHSTTSNS